MYYIAKTSIKGFQPIIVDSAETYDRAYLLMKIYSSRNKDSNFIILKEYEKKK